MTGTFASFTAPQATSAGDLTSPSHFEQFVLAYSGIVLTVCLRMLKDRVAAEDAVQETFVAAWRHRSQLRPNRAWLLRVATNKCLDELRRRSRHREHTAESHEDDGAWYVNAPEPSPEAVVLNTETGVHLQHALLQLPWTQRQAVILSDIEGWSYLEIAGTCGVSIGTVKSRIFRARSTLREALVGIGSSTTLPE